jgi:hypothetical protein
MSIFEIGYGKRARIHRSSSERIGLGSHRKKEAGIQAWKPPFDLLAEGLVSKKSRLGRI